jgi:hypothetical protein
LEAVFVLLEFPSPSRRIFIGSHSLPPLWFAVSMAYQELGSGPPHFDGKNYQMWSKQMVAFLRGKGQILWDVTVDTGYVQLMNFLAPGSRDMFDANNKSVDYLFRAVSA